MAIAEDLSTQVIPSERSDAVLLLIDVINDLEFPEGDQLLQFARPMAHCIAALKQRLKGMNIPAIYVNDNFGRWRSDFKAQIAHCLRDNVRGQSIVELLHPQENDYFVLKPRHSGFYSTTLEILLEALGAKTLILTGMATNICVLFTANDAYMRGLKLFVPRDCVACNSAAENQQTLALMEKILKADTRESTQLTPEVLLPTQ
jgi:nicotinamidase-related amidase